MHLHQAPHHGQAQSQTAVLSCDAAVGLAKSIEDKGKEFGRDSYAGVNYLDFSLPVEIPEVYFHGAPRRGELDGVLYQIPDHLLKPVGVNLENMYGRVERLLQTHPFGLRLRAYGVDRRFDNRGESGRFNIKREIAGADARNIEQVVDQIFLRAGVALNNLQRAVFAIFVEAFPPNEHDPAE